MNEMILELILNQIDAIVLYSFFSVMGIVAIVLLLTFYEFKNASIKYRVYPFLLALFMMVILGVVPRIGLTYNLLKDYNRQTEIAKEGVVTQQFIKLKMIYIEVDNERFLLSKKFELPNIGDKCEFLYLEHSHLVYDLIIRKE